MASPSSPTDSNPPSAVPLPLPAPPPPSSSSRRLPPPCWTPEETAALIDAYRDKWYSLGRTNLKATHWQEVADTVTARCPNASPTAKTAVQCRHKMEKLRKRYRTEIQRLRCSPIRPFSTATASPSSWVHFKSMDSMERGPTKPEPLNFLDSNDNENENENNNNNHDDDDDLYEEFKNANVNATGSNTRSINKLYKNNGFNPGSGQGFRIRIAQHGPAKLFNGPPGMMPRGASNGNGGAKRERERDAVAEMVGAIKMLRDGFVRMEQMKMEMAREIESMRMEMEMKRTEMILESQQRIVEAFARAVAQKRSKGKNTPSPSQP